MNARPDIDLLMTDWLRAQAPERADGRVLAAVLDRVAVVGQERTFPRWFVGDRSGTTRTTLIAATAALLVLLAAAAFIGSQVRDDVLPAPVAPPVIPVAPPAPAVPPATRVDSGSAETELGQVGWTAVEGDATNIPSGEIFATPTGYASIEPDLDHEASRFWVSTDGLSWTVAPMPVPATGSVAHRVAAGEHWIWSDTEVRLWRSADFAAWTEVDLDGLRPPPIEGVTWRFSSVGPATTGSTTVFPWQVTGTLELEDLLDIEPKADHTVIVGFGRDEPVMGEPRDVWRVPHSIIGYDSENKEVVGSILVDRDEQVVSVTDAERGIVVASIDAGLIGADAAVLADELHRFGFIRGPAGGAVIADGVARALVPPPNLSYLATVDGRFLGLSEDFLGDGSRLVWTSADGVMWESLGRPELPSSTHYLGPLRQADSSSGEPLIATVLIDEGETQRNELWSSTDGRTWTSVAVLNTYPEPGLNPVQVPGGYLAKGEDFKVHASTAGVEWSTVEGIDGVGRSIDANGGTSMFSAAGDAVFLVDLPLTADRFMWVLRIEARP